MPRSRKGKTDAGRNEFDKLVRRYIRRYPNRPFISCNVGGATAIVYDSDSVDLDPFVEVVGALMFDAWHRPKGSILHTEYIRIAKGLDREGFKLRDHLEPKGREALTDWNRTHPGHSISTWTAAIEPASGGSLIERRMASAVHRHVLISWYVAVRKYKKIHTTDSSSVDMAP